MESDKPLKLAVIVAFPAANEVARPLDPVVLLIVATDGDDELQLTTFVII